MTQDITITKTVCTIGGSIGIIIDKEVAKALDIIPGDLVEARLKKVNNEPQPQ
jgi:antitoxin component of MazEF toxin-antitoxin module